AREPVAIMNTTISGFVMSQIGVIKDEGIATFTGASSAQFALDKKGVPNLLRIRTADSRVPAAATKFVLGTLGAKRVAVLHVNSEYAMGWSSAIAATLTASGLKPVVVESLEASDRDVTGQLLRIKNANADVLIVAGDPPQHVVVVKQVRQLGLTMKVVLSNSGVFPSTLRLYPPGAAEGMYGMADSLPAGDPALKEWAAEYRKMFNIDPDASAAEYYDGVMMFAKAVAKVGTKADAVAKELRTIDGYVGIGNVYTFANKADGGQALAIVQIKGNRLELVTHVR
ncbi:MAG: ABC transporter substrate-binding protein, partial [Rhodospirillaceae bacterium]|nr:ABC transporter substrate-binding protein [Rhodospirillaceae bacterium]